MLAVCALMLVPAAPVSVPQRRERLVPVMSASLRCDMPRQVRSAIGQILGIAEGSLSPISIYLTASGRMRLLSLVA